MIGRLCQTYGLLSAWHRIIVSYERTVATVSRNRSGAYEIEDLVQEDHDAIVVFFLVRRAGSDIGLARVEHNRVPLQADRTRS